MKIDKKEFEKITKKYQDNNPGKTHAVIMDREAFERLLASGAKQVAIYFAQNDEGTDTVAIVGLVNGKIDYSTAENRGGACPPFCPPEQ